MPYTNVPDDLQDEMESCVQQVMADGRPKESAIAICHSSIVKGEDCPGCPKRSKARKPHTKAQVLATLTDEAAPDDDRKALTLEAITEQRAAEQRARAKAQLVDDMRAVLESCDPEDEETPMHMERQANAFKRAWLAITGAAASARDAIAEKVGARHSKADTDAIQGVHDAAVQLGAMCAKAARTGGAFHVVKAADGNPVWIGVVSNKFRDRDGEIITDAAHKEFLAWLDANPDQAPVLRSWHVPGTERKSRADTWGYADGFLFMSGPLTDEEAAQFGDGEELGMSHGFKAAKQGADIVQYRSFEVSELPVEAAANPWTDFSVSKEATMFDNAEQRAHLVKRFGEDRVRELESAAAENAKALADAGVEFKEYG